MYKRNSKGVGYIKNKIIKDIRLYKSQAQNDNGTYITNSFADKKLNAIVQRIVMKLRENEFSFGEFDHLYINFTTCDMAEKISLSNEIDKYHSWYRYCSVWLERDLYDKLGFPEAYDDIICLIKKVLVTFFTNQDFNESRILSCIQQAVEQGEKMMMKFKEKVSTKRRVEIFLRYLDDGNFSPLLRVYDMENMLLEKDLPKTLTLDYLGDIQISTKCITIKPRKNSFSTNKKALVFEC